MFFGEQGIREGKIVLGLTCAASKDTNCSTVYTLGTSQLVQWQRIHLSMQGMQETESLGQ